MDQERGNRGTCYCKSGGQIYYKFITDFPLTRDTSSATMSASKPITVRLSVVRLAALKNISYIRLFCRKYLG